MDVIGTPEREPRPLPAWLSRGTGRLVAAAAVAVAGVVVVGVAAAGVVTTGPEPAPTAPSIGPGPAAPVGPPDLGIRGVGGTSSVVGAGAQGTLEVEVRNGSRTVRLAGLTAQVPGVRFVRRTPPNGATLTQDGLIRLELGYTIGDCAQVVDEGQIVFTLIEPEGLVELVLPVFDDAGQRRQSALDRVLDACPA